MLKVIRTLEEAHKNLLALEHIVNVTFPIFKDKKILGKLLPKIAFSFKLVINSILQYEFLKGKISLSKNKEENLRKFEVLAKSYAIDGLEIETVKRIFELNDVYSKSSMIFTRNDNLVILFGESEKYFLSEKVIKDYVSLLRKFYQKVKEKLFIEGKV